MKNFAEIQLGEGVLTYNAGAGDVEIGFTRGGTFADGSNVRHIAVDGKPGNTKGDAVMDEISPVLNFTMVQMKADVLAAILANVSVTDVGGVKTLKRKHGPIADDQYLDNVMYVGQKMDGKDVTIKLTEALGEGPLSLSYNDKGEVELPLVFTGNYATVADTDAPFELIIDETV